MLENYVDRVEWSFLRKILGKMWFIDRCIDLIMECVTSVSFKVKVNGELSRSFTPDRWLRQRNPYPPYLFLLCVEGFLALFNKAKEQDHISRIKIWQAAPCISHLLFADDSLILVHANREVAMQLQSILELFERCLVKW